VLDKPEDVLEESAKLRISWQMNVTWKEQQNPAGIQKRELFNCKKQPGGLSEVSESEIQWRKSAAECLKRAWPAVKKGAHRVKDCQKQLNQTKGTASHPRNKQLLAKKYRKSEVQTDIEDGGSGEEGDCLLDVILAIESELQYYQEDECITGTDRYL
jgi:hypothetical protein